MIVLYESWECTVTQRIIPSYEWSYLWPLWIKVKFPEIVNGKALCFKWPVRVHLVPAGWVFMTAHFGLKEGFGGPSKPQISARKWSFSPLCLCPPFRWIVAQMRERSGNLWSLHRFSGISIFSWAVWERWHWRVCGWFDFGLLFANRLPNRHMSPVVILYQPSYGQRLSAGIKRQSNVESP